MFEYVQHQSGGVIRTLRNLLSRKEIYFFTFVFVFFINIYLFTKINHLQTTTVEFISGEELKEELNVEIAGAVNIPGVYRLQNGSLLIDLVNSANGLSDSANSSYIMKNVNLASRLNNNSKVYIPFSWEELNDKEHEISYTKFPGDVDDGVGEVVSSTTVSEEQFEINTYSKDQLIDIKGVGEAYAKRILDGVPYKDTDDFYARSNIPKTLAEYIVQTMTNDH